VCIYAKVTTPLFVQISISSLVNKKIIALNPVVLQISMGSQLKIMKVSILMEGLSVDEFSK
jgi:hypothetical protein